MEEHLTQNALQGFENQNLKFNDINKDTRYLNLLSFTYNPVFFKNLYLGYNRAFQLFTQDNPSNNLTQLLFNDAKSFI